MPRYSRDPRWIKAKFESQCSRRECQCTIKRGEDAFYYPNGRKILCQKDECGGQASREFSAAAADEDGYGF